MPDTVYKHEVLTGADQYYYDLRFPGASGWSDGLAMFSAYQAPTQGTIPIYQHRAPDGRYFYDNLNYNNFGWTPGTVAFYAYSTQVSGTVPVYCHEASGGRYYFDTLPDNDYGWGKGTVVWYAYPVNTTLIDDLMYVLSRDPVRYQGVTYGDFKNNKFFACLDTPGLWDQGPSSAYDLLSHRNANGPFPIPACENLLHHIWFIIGSARSFIDITLLYETNVGLPGAEFQQALSHGIWGFEHSYDDPNKVIRILVGMPDGATAYNAELENWLRATVEVNGRQKVSDLKCSIYLARTHQSINSWNHSKIIAVDGGRAIVGGHNLWPGPYLGPSPTFDVSGLFYGEAAVGAHQFCNSLWTQTWSDTVVLQNGQIKAVPQATGRPPDFKPRTDIDHTEGTARMLGLGRLGGMSAETSIASNASVSARLVALCRAQHSIRISQQGFDFQLGDYDFYTCLAVVKAIHAGVQVSIVVSNAGVGSDSGYKGYLDETVKYLRDMYIRERLGLFGTSFANPSRTDLPGWTIASLNPPSTTLAALPGNLSRAAVTQCIDELNSRLSIAGINFSRGVDYWLVGGNEKIPASNHAKVYIIDDTHFYVGSDNFYESGTVHGLQEYGYLVEDQSATQEFIASYWDKLWKNSSQALHKAVSPF